MGRIEKLREFYGLCCASVPANLHFRHLCV